LYKLFNSENASRSGRIDIFVTHHAQIFECVGVVYIVTFCHNREEAGGLLSDLESKQITSDFCVFREHCHRQRFPVGISSEPVEHGLQLDRREKSSENS